CGWAASGCLGRERRQRSEGRPRRLLGQAREPRSQRHHAYGIREVSPAPRLSEANAPPGPPEVVRAALIRPEGNRGSRELSMDRVLLLMTTATYRAGAFLEAAARV